MNVTVLFASSGWFYEEVLKLVSAGKTIHLKEGLILEKGKQLGNEIVCVGKLTSEDVKKILPDKAVTVRPDESSSETLPGWFKMKID